MNRKTLIGALVAVIVLSGTSTSYALVNVDDTTKVVKEVVETTVDDTTAKVDDVVSEVKPAVDVPISRSERIAQRKAELQLKLQQKREDRKERLEGRRLAQCQNRQDNINRLMQKSVETGRRHLENIQRVETSVKTFAEKKSIDSESYQASLQDVDEKEAAAIASIDVMEAETFDCSMIDGAKPAFMIRTVREAKQTAMRDYRDSVVQLIQSVKDAFASTQSADDAAKTEEQ